MVMNAKKRLLQSSSEHEYAYNEKADKKEPRLLYTISLEPWITHHVKQFQTQGRVGQNVWKRA